VAELNSTIREAVRARYAAAALRATAGTEGSEGGCGCGPGDPTGDMAFGAPLYAGTEEEPALATSLGCGVPTAVADLARGETVLDLGSGGGADVLISARRVGPEGRAIGLDMTDEMLELARRHAAEAGIANAEFLRGYIEEIPLPDASVDVVISNCVINLAADKRRVLAEAARVLRPGGRFAVSDVLADDGLRPAAIADVASWTGCIAGALTRDAFVAELEAAGLREIEIHDTHRVHEHAAAAIIRARKPAGRALAMASAACALTGSELRSQLERYRQLGAAAVRIEHRERELIVEFGDDVDRALLEQTVTTERGCCGFFRIASDRGSGRLSITIDDAVHTRELAAIAAALRPPAVDRWAVGVDLERDLPGLGPPGTTAGDG
jgi:ubiquinone/menaquinone biosynthesis C-methylase UbiE